MRIKQLLSIGLLASLGLSAIAQVAGAYPMKKDSKGAIVVGGLTAGSSYAIQYPNVPLTTKATSDACGWAKLKMPDGVLPSQVSSLVVNGVTSGNSMEDPTYNTGPICASGVQTNPDVGNPPCGWLIKTASTFYYKTTASTPVTVSFPGFGKTRKITANDCALLKISSSTAWPTPITGSFVLKDLGLNDVATIPLTSIATGNVPKCSDGVIYTPPGWN